MSQVAHNADTAGQLQSRRAEAEAYAVKAANPIQSAYFQGMAEAYGHAIEIMEASPNGRSEP